MLPRVSPYPIPELEAFLQPFRQHFYRRESLQVLERCATGLLAEIERKSGAGIAQAVAGLSEAALYRLLAETEWDHTALNRQRIATMVEVASAGDGMLVLDETGYPRKGNQCVGVAHQDWGALGKTANGQVVVTADYADPYFSWPVAGRLYLPAAWCDDDLRRQQAQIPTPLIFPTKPEIALDLLDQARTDGIPFSMVAADSRYGDNPACLDGLDERHLECVVAVASDFGVRLPDEVSEAAAQPLPAKKKAGRPRSHPHPVQVAPWRRADAVMDSQAEAAWQTLTWRRGSAGAMTKQFVAVRAQRSHGDITGPAGWRVGERPVPGQAGERKTYWSRLATNSPLARLAGWAQRRPSIERTYQEGKSDTALDAYPARLWHSFHRHLVIEMLVLSWLVLQQPAPASTPIGLEPQPVASPEQPVFPLRS